MFATCVLLDNGGQIKLCLSVLLHSDTLLRHDRSNEFCRGNIETWVIDPLQSHRRDHNLGLLNLTLLGRWINSASNKASLQSRPLFDGNLSTAGCGEVDSGDGCDDDDWDFVSCRDDGGVVGPDLVGCITVLRDAVCTDDDCVDVVVLEEGSDHGVADHDGGYLESLQLEGC